MENPLSVQLYSVRDSLATDRDAVLGRLARMGYGAVEPFRPTDDPEGFRRVADDLGLRVSSVHANTVLGDEQEAVFDAAHILGTDQVIIPAGFPHAAYTSRDGLERIAEQLNATSQRAKDHGLRFGVHNHWWELEPRIDDQHALEVLSDLLEPDVFLQVDTYWAAVGGADVPLLLRRLGNRVLSLHVKDGPGTKDQPHTALGRGIMPIPEILAAGAAAQWWIVELDDCATDVFAALEESHAYLEKVRRP